MNQKTLQMAAAAILLTVHDEELNGNMLVPQTHIFLALEQGAGLTMEEFRIVLTALKSADLIKPRAETIVLTDKGRQRVLEYKAKLALRAQQAALNAAPPTNPPAPTG